MESDLTSLSFLNLEQLDLLSINTTQLAIACRLFPNHIHPRILTPMHITAIKINISNHFTNLSFSPVADDDLDTLIAQAHAYGQYRSCLHGIEFGQRNIREEYFNHLLDKTRGMNLFEFSTCVSNWKFIERLQHEGTSAQKEVLEKGWAAYMYCPQVLVEALGLKD